jgi:hypothetical protein
MVFSIKQYSQLPVLQMSLYRDGRNDYKNFDEFLENSVGTFAMKNEATGIYKVVNKAADITLQDPCDINGKKEYYISYTFTSSDTSEPGIYIGEFSITYIPQNLQGSQQLIVPIAEPLYIHIIDSFIKSDVSYLY